MYHPGWLGTAAEKKYEPDNQKGVPPSSAWAVEQNRNTPPSASRVIVRRGSDRQQLKRPHGILMTADLSVALQSLAGCSCTGTTLL